MYMINESPGRLRSVEKHDLGLHGFASAGVGLIILADVSCDKIP